MGKCSVEYCTKDGTALEGSDYVRTEGVLVFEQGETRKKIRIEIINSDEYEKEEMFTLRLSNPQNCLLGNLTTAFITIGEDAELRNLSDQITKLFNINRDLYRVGSESWRQQFRDAFEIPDDLFTQIMHWITLPWKVLFAICPPTKFFGGYLTFVVSLSMIGGVTTLISDLATLLGCSLGLKDSVTAITIVALGTSLPDTVASRTAAIMDDTADAAIGNVTGSNSVNVFLGLGISWTIGAVYWHVVGATPIWQARVSPEIFAQYPTGAFNYPSGDLGFAVVTFIIAASSCLFTIVFKRIKFGTELGGPYSISFAKKILANSFEIREMYFFI
eukprot:Lithocolla_globosa_v1_NODE_1489_length_2538_cov_14.496979.p1 type:complete len:331 gc:universal NODE_1489_length_2538_cov_14.496979:1046-54(-)